MRMAQMSSFGAAVRHRERGRQRRPVLIRYRLMMASEALPSTSIVASSTLGAFREAASHTRRRPRNVGSRDAVVGRQHAQREEGNRGREIYWHITWADPVRRWWACQREGCGK